MFEIKQLSVENLDELVEFSNKEISYNKWNEQNFTAAISKPQYLSLGAFLNGQLAGFIIFYNAFEESTLMIVCVKQEFKRKQIATKLFDDAVLILKNANINKVFLEVKSTNAPATSFYQKLGFSVLRVRKAYYSDGSDAVEFMLEI